MTTSNGYVMHRLSGDERRAVIGVQRRFEQANWNARALERQGKNWPRCLAERQKALRAAQTLYALTGDPEWARKLPFEERELAKIQARVDAIERVADDRN